jgi:hypothetical protein
MLAGVYESNHILDERILEAIKQWQMPEAVRNLGPQKLALTLQEYRTYWKKAREDMACYPSELSFSTMKAGAWDEQIARLDWVMTKLPLELGFSPRRWKCCLDIMLFKKSGLTDLSSLRTIALFPVDCNFAFKHVGRAMLTIADQTKSLALEQYGSRKKHQAIDLAVNKALTFDTLHQTKRAGAICSNDTKSCYDLIGHKQVALSMQRVGVPKNIVNCLFTTLQEAVHRVRTGFGDSEAHYWGAVWLMPIHGIGQGNGAGPAIWAVVSTPILNALREQGFGCEIVRLLSSHYTKFVGYAFVDNTDIIQAALSNNASSAMKQLQEAVDAWKFSLKVTCSALVPEKIVWWLVSFLCNGNSWQDCPGDLFVNNIMDQQKKVE